MRRWILVLMLCAGPLALFAQKQSAIWYFGNHAGLDFREHFPIPLTDGMTDTPEGTASVADSLGNLLFYTDGMTIWNRNHGIIAAGLSGDPASAHSATIVPNRLNSKQHFVFTTKSVSSPEDDNYGGNYYIVDFSEDTLGELIYDHSAATGEPGILKNSTEKFVAVPFMQTVEGESQVPSYRLVMHQFNTDSFAIYNLDSLVYHFRSQQIGSGNVDSLYGNGSGGSGQIKMSLQGDRIAVALEGEHRFEVYNFNKVTGQLSNPIYLPAGDRELGKTNFVHKAYGVEFSPNGRYLFGTSRDGGVIYRWNLNASEDAMRAQVIFIANKLENECGALQLAPNGKIYVAWEGLDYLSVINLPNNNKPEYVEFGARLLDNETGKGGTAGMGLPVQIPGSLKDEAFYYYHTCLGEKTKFFINLTGLQSPLFVINDSGGTYVDAFSGRYDPESGGTVYEYTFRQAGDYRVVLTAFRNGVVEFTRKLTIHAPPPKTWPQDTVICRGSQLVLDAGDGAFYDWVDAGARERRLFIDSLGTNPATGVEYASKEFRVAVTHYNGCVVWDTITVLRKFPPELRFETTMAKCAENNGTATVFPNGNVGDFSYYWEDFPEVTGNTITGIGGGEYWVNVTSKLTGCSSSIEIPVNAQGTVKIIASVDTLVCPGTQVILTAANADEIEWIFPDGITDRQITVSPAETTTYRVRGISQDGEGGICETEDEYTIEVAPVIIPELGEDKTGCRGDTVWVDASDGFLEYEWSNGLSGKHIPLTESISRLVLTVRDTNYCYSTNSINVTIFDPPQIETVAQKATCGQENGMASVVPPGNPNEYTYSWEGFPEVKINKLLDVGAGIYRVLVTSLETGCDTLAEIVVQEFGAPDTEIIASTGDTVCPGTPVTLTAVNGDYFIWINPEGSREEQITVEPFTETTYTVMGVSRDDEGNECRAYADYTIFVLPYNKPELGDDLFGCEGDTLAVDGGESYLEWSWSNGMAGREIFLTVNDPELVLTAVDINNCPVKDTIGITFYPLPEVDLGPDQTLCTNEPVVLQGGTGEFYLWSTDETSPQIAVDEKGVYWLDITTSGCSARDSVLIQLVNPDSIRIDSVVARDISCFGEVDGEIRIFAGGSGDTYTYSIDGGDNYFDNNGHFSKLPAGEYIVNVLEDNVCYKEYGLPVIITEPEGITAEYQLTSPSCYSCIDGRIVLTLVDGGSPPFSILWDNLETGFRRTGIGVGSYSVRITDSRGCDIYIPFELDMSYNIPDAFTPNGDGVNDLWTIRILENYPQSLVQVYNAGGMLVFESAPGYPEPWDGRSDGEYLPMGTYYFIIKLDDTEKPIKGSLTLLR